jgi:plastocyanin
MTVLNTLRARWIFAVAAVSAALLLLLALQGPDASAGGVAQASRAKTVNIANFAFKPGKLTVAKGTKVTFSNSDGVPHTATRAGSFDTGRISPDSAKSVKLSRAGTFAYHCSIHPSMHGKIVVK